jgi:hypothetical protein
VAAAVGNRAAPSVNLYLICFGCHRHQPP